MDSSRSCVQQAVANVGVGRFGAGAGGGVAAPRLAVSSYLESDGKGVTEGLKEWTEVRSCGCRSRFCSNCCLPLGLQLKRRLLPELAKFKSLMMLTFTIDPELFESASEAHDYVLAHRCIAVTIQRLFRWGLLHSRRYVCVVEWQKLTQQAHWHVLVDASFIPFDQLCEAWNRNWKQWRERVALGRPGFGSVRFTVSKFKSASHAACYATKYLIKHPEHGYPDWVKDSPTRRVRRFSTSRGFWSDGGGDGAPAGSGDAEFGTASQAVDDGSDEARPRRTIREQLATCGLWCAMLRVREVPDEATGEIVPVRTFVRLLPVPIAVVLGLETTSVNQRGTAATFDLSYPLVDRIAAINDLDRILNAG